MFITKVNAGEVLKEENAPLEDFWPFEEACSKCGNTPDKHTVFNFLPGLPFEHDFVPSGVKAK